MEKVNYYSDEFKKGVVDEVHKGILSKETNTCMHSLYLIYLYKYHLQHLS